MLRITAFVCAALVAVSAHAATVSVEVRGSDGRPLPDAVVTVQSPHAPTGPIRFPWPMVVRQQNISFEPHVLIVPVGAKVGFPNFDNVRHHVYSFSKPKKFQLKLYGQEETRSVLFDKPGVVAIGCNIHDSMSGFVVVVNTPYAAKTDAKGHAVIEGVPAGPATLTLWSPKLRAPGNTITQPLEVAPQGVSRTLSVGS